MVLYLMIAVFRCHCHSPSLNRSCDCLPLTLRKCLRGKFDAEGSICLRGHDKNRRKKFHETFARAVEIAQKVSMRIAA